MSAATPHGTCLVCHAPARPGLRPASCGSADCLGVLAHASHLPADQFERYLACEGQLLAQQRERRREHLGRIERQRQEEAAEDRRQLDAAIAADPELAAAGAVAVAIPSAPTRVVPVPVERRAAYLAHLEAVAAEAVADDPDDEVEAAEAEPVAPRLQDRCDSLCGLCRGGCCVRGGDEAYVSAATMRRQLAAAPTDAAGLVDRYRAHLPTRHIAGSCINHTDTGCALPRELRSGICNRFYCGGLEDYRASAGAPPAPVVAVQRGHTNWDRFEPTSDHRVIAVTVVDDAGHRALPIASEPSGDPD